MALSVQQRHEYRLRSVHATVAIENNPLTFEQVTAVIAGKHVPAKPSEIKEVQNAWAAYALLPVFKPFEEKALLKAHLEMMQDLTAEADRFRSGAVGVFKGQELVHLAPPAALVPGQIRNLLAWYLHSDLHPLIKSAVFHYEFEFIHPFADGNGRLGRLGRLWHTLLLGHWRELFRWIPLEDQILTRRKEYYAALAEADRKADCAVFVELLLELTVHSLEELIITHNRADQGVTKWEIETVSGKTCDSIGL